MSAAVTPDLLEEMLDDLVVDGSDDWVMLGSVGGTVTTTTERHGIQLRLDDRISAGLDVIRLALVRELVIAGDVRDPEGFVPWASGEAATLDRIERGWRDAGESLVMGDVAWLANTPAGDAYAETVLDAVNDRHGWRPSAPD